MSRTTSILAVKMHTNTAQHNASRARRFALHIPVFFRQPQSSGWLEGTTENISYTGLSFLSSSPLPPKTALELRLQLTVGAERKRAGEISCRGTVVRVEQRDVPETPVALAVAIREFRIVRQTALQGEPAATTKTQPKSRQRPN